MLANLLATSKVAIDTSHAVFPMDNFDLEVSKWEDDIIWDSENMPAAPGDNSWFF